jgi:hypothetical protein
VQPHPGKLGLIGKEILVIRLVHMIDDGEIKHGCLCGGVAL